MSSSPRRRPLAILFEYSGFLLLGTVVAFLWANLDPDQRDEDGQITRVGSYHRFVHFPLLDLVGGQPKEQSAEENPLHAESSADESSAEDGSEGHETHGSGHGMTVHFLINDVLMALFFAIASKEVRESLLPGGVLSNPRKAATPLLATLGGIVGPAGVYLLGAALVGQLTLLGRGWAIPCATDIAFSYLVARIIFGAGHPAIAFLLLLAIADDAAGLIILAVFYPQGDVQPWWLLLTAFAILLGFAFQRMRLHSFWWYLLIPGVLSWYSFYRTGVHAALGLVPIIICMPHAFTDLGVFAREELMRHDTLNEFEHFWKKPVEVILGLFGLVNAGVVVGSMGYGTTLVLVGLLLGKPLGITLFTWLAEKAFKLEVPAGMSYRHVLSLGMVAAIGFTVALFISTAAFYEPGPLQDSAKMGALLSFLAAGVAFVMARAMGIRPVTPHESS